MTSLRRSLRWTTPSHPKTTVLISHRMPLEEGPVGYQKFHDEQDTYTKIVLKTGEGSRLAA